MVTNIGDSTNAKTVVSDNATPANGTYAWYIIGDTNFIIPRNAMRDADRDTAVSVNIKEKYFDLTGVCRITYRITTAADYDNWLDALDYWDANDTWLYLSVKNEWAVNLATRGTQAAPTVQGQWRGKLFMQRFNPLATEVSGSIEFRYTTQ